MYFDEYCPMEVFADDYARYAAFCRLHQVSLMDGLGVLMDMACVGSAAEMEEMASGAVELSFDSVRKWTEEELVELERRAEEGEYAALLGVAVTYVTGQAPQDFEKAYGFACRAAETGNPDSLFLAGMVAFLSERNDDAYPWFERGAALKHTRSEFMLGLCHLVGWGCMVDTKKAMILLNRAYKKRDDLGDVFVRIMERIYEMALKCIRDGGVKN